MSGKFFEILAESKAGFRRFKANTFCASVKLLPPPLGSDAVQWFTDSLASLIEHITATAGRHDMVGMNIKNLTRSMDKPIGISVRRKKDFNIEAVWEIVARVLQSNADFGVTDNILICAEIIKTPHGNGGIKRKGRPEEELVGKKKSIVFINGDKHCLAKALVIGVAHASGDRKLYKALRNAAKDHTRTSLDIASQKLMDDAGVDLSDGGGITELQKFQEFIKNFNIVVYDGLNHKNIVFNGGNNLRDIHLLFYDNHYDVIVNPRAAFAVEYYCKACKGFYKNAKFHRCNEKCPCCQSNKICEKVTALDCSDCLREFRSEKCYNLHKTNMLRGKNVCNYLNKCKECSKSFCTSRKHECYTSWCTVCHKNVPRGHLCYIQRVMSSPPSDKKVLFIFYDFESRVESPIPSTSTEHKPNLVHIQQFCATCEFDETLTHCSDCGERSFTFSENPVSNFVDFLRKDRSFDKIVCLAHFGKGYDMHFLLGEFLERKWTPTVIMKGTEILTMKVEHLIFLDSLNYLPMSLAALPKAFNLPAQKGYYPHLFNKKENEDYIGPYPAPSYYGVDYMKIAERETFFQWYDTVKDKIFENKKQILEYCIADVTVLRQAAQKFRRLFLSIGNVDPFLESITIASTCNKMFRRKYLKPNTIGLIPPQGYRMGDRQSKEALKWLIHMEKTLGVPIRHSGNGREVSLPQLGGKRPDGYIEGERHLLEYFGCFWHGCPVCFRLKRDEDIQGIKGDSLESRYRNTLERIIQFQNLGYKVTYTWGCKFKPSDELNNHPMVTSSPLVARDALYGGRTEAYKTYYKISGDEKIKYIDICSLYPFICKYFKTIVSHPTVHVGENCPNWEQLTEGLIKCTVLPPRDLYHPVLPYKLHNKLFFPLCRVCSEILSCENCKHNDEQRALTGTWVLDEVKLAVEMGYRIIKIHEFWEYEVTQYDRESGTGGLFTEYVNAFLKYKTEASGWPYWANNQELKEKYIKDYFKAEGVRLDAESIETNPGLRLMSKLVLNSMWGKFCQSENKTQTSIVKDRAQLLDLVHRPGIEVSKCVFVNEDIAWINWKYTEENIVPSKITNVVIASYVTTGARIALYDYLRKLGDKVLYVDTDSCVYVHSDQDSYKPSLGEYLGDMTNELESYGSEAYGIEWVSGGPKNYGLSIKNPDTGVISEICKVKGVTLNYSTSKQINFKSMKGLVQKPKSDPIKVINPIKIKRKRPGVVVTEKDNKDYNVVFTKRRRINHDSFPYGFILK